MSLKKLVWLAPFVFLVGCNSIGYTHAETQYGDYKPRDLEGLTTDSEDDLYWRARYKQECGAIDDQIMLAKCGDALRAERRKGSTPKN